MHILLQRLADRGASRVSLLSDSHPLRAILGAPLVGSDPAHRLGLTSGGTLSRESLLGPSSDMARVNVPLHRDEVESYGSESQPGSRVVDLFASQIHSRSPPSRKEEEMRKYVQELDSAWAKAQGDPLCLVVAADASVPSDSKFQATAAALIFGSGVQVGRITTAAGKRTPPEVERFALQIGISAALAKECQELVVFSDSLPAVNTIFSPELRSGQIFSLDCCRAIRPWLAGDVNRKITLWHVPARLEWGVHQKAHDVATSVKVSVGSRPRTSRDFLLLASDKKASSDWHAGFSSPAYRGRQFLDLVGPGGKHILPSTHKGGPWLSGMEEESVTTFSRLCRGITGHAPIGEYRRRFNIDGPIHCDCSHGVVQTRDHLQGACRLVERPYRHKKPRSVSEFYATLGLNVGLYAFSHTPRLMWDPG
jgi:hypothetical protein